MVLDVRLFDGKKKLKYKQNPYCIMDILSTKYVCP